MPKPLCLFGLLFCLACLGCSTSRVTMTTSNGDSVTNEGSKGFGNVAGVNFTIMGLKSATAGVEHSTNTVQAADKTATTTERWLVKMGDVKMVFEKNVSGEISLEIDNQSFGNVSTGDTLEIDENRTVSINGKTRVKE